MIIVFVFISMNSHLKVGFWYQILIRFKSYCSSFSDLLITLQIFHSAIAPQPDFYSSATKVCFFIIHTLMRTVMSCRFFGFHVSKGDKSWRRWDSGLTSTDTLELSAGGD